MVLRLLLIKGGSGHSCCDESGAHDEEIDDDRHGDGGHAQFF